MPDESPIYGWGQWVRRLLLLPLVLPLSACVASRMYQPVNIQPEAGYTLA